MIKLIIYILVAILGVLLYVRFLERTTLFYPTKDLLSSPKDMDLGFENVYFKTEDQANLHGWFIPSISGNPEPATIIFMHGNAGNIGDRLEKILIFHQMGLNVFIFDYRGYGLSSGHPTERGMYADARAAYDYVVSRPGIAIEKIALYGASLGGVAAIDLATHREVACLIVDSTFTSAADMSKVIVPFIPSAFLSIKLDSLGKIKTLTIPKLFIHSPDDETVPFRLGKKLFDAAPGPKEFLKINGNHNDAHMVSQRTFTGGIRAFLRQYGLIKD